MRPVLVWAALLATPIATAQLPVQVVTPTLAVAFDAQGEPLAAGTTLRLPYRIEYGIPGPHAGTFVVSLVPMGVPPGWTVSSEPPQHEVRAGPSTEGSYVLEGALLARHDGTPLAFRAETIGFEVHAPGDGAVVGPAWHEGAVAVTADWRPGLFVELPAPRLHLHERGGRDTLGGEMWNTGNADVRVTGAVLRAPAGCDTAIESAPSTLAPGQRAPIRLAVDCARGWDAGSVTARFEHALAFDAARAGDPVEPQWDLVPVDTRACADSFWGCSGGSSSGGVARTYGDAPVSSRNEVSWGATLLVPMALALAAMIVRRR